MAVLTIRGAFGVGNIGDDAILISMLSSIENRLKDTNFIIFAGNSIGITDIKEKYNIKIISFSLQRKESLLEVIKGVSNSDLFIYGGGGLLYDHHGMRILLLNLSTVIMAKILRKPTMFYSIGVGPLNTNIGKFIIKTVANQVDLITVRDSQSKSLLKMIGVNKPPIYVTLDPAFFLTPQSTALTQKIIKEYRSEQIDRNKFLIGISLRCLKTEQFDIKVIAHVCDQLIESYNAKIIFFPMCDNKEAWFEKDLNVANELNKLLQRKNEFEILSGNYSPAEIKEIVGHMDLFIGMRLHSLIFSTCMSIPTVGIIYDPKVKEYLQIFDQDEYTIDIHNITEKELLKIIKDVYDQSEKIRTDLTNRQKYLQRKVPSATKVMYNHFTELL